MVPSHNDLTHRPFIIYVDKLFLRAWLLSDAPEWQQFSQLNRAPVCLRTHTACKESLRERPEPQGFGKQQKHLIKAFLSFLADDNRTRSDHNFHEQGTTTASLLLMLITLFFLWISSILDWSKTSRYTRSFTDENQKLPGNRGPT